MVHNILYVRHKISLSFPFFVFIVTNDLKNIPVTIQFFNILFYEHVHVLAHVYVCINSDLRKDHNLTSHHHRVCLILYDVNKLYRSKQIEMLMVYWQYVLLDSINTFFDVTSRCVEGRLKRSSRFTLEHLSNQHRCVRRRRQLEFESQRQFVAF